MRAHVAHSSFRIIIAFRHSQIFALHGKRGCTLTFFCKWNMYFEKPILDGLPGCIRNQKARIVEWRELKQIGNDRAQCDDPFA